MSKSNCEHCEGTGEIYADHEIGTTSCTCLEGRLRQIEMMFSDRNPMNTTLDERIDEVSDLLSKAREESAAAYNALSKTEEFKLWDKFLNVKNDLTKELEALIFGKQYGLVTK